MQHASHSHAEGAWAQAHHRALRHKSHNCPATEPPQAIRGQSNWPHSTKGMLQEGGWGRGQYSGKIASPGIVLGTFEDGGALVSCTHLVSLGLAGVISACFILECCAYVVSVPISCKISKYTPVTLKPYSHRVHMQRLRGRSGICPQKRR